MKKYLPLLAAVIVVGALSFYGGLRLADSKSAEANSMQGNSQRNMQAGQGQLGARTGGPGQMDGSTGVRNMLSGEIIGTDGKSITIKLPTGGSKIIFLSDSTKITKSVDASMADLLTGITVMTSGKTNTDGSITAKTIQINPNLSTLPSPTQPTQQQGSTQQ
jgi:hypothetical protein